jgi:hypothetical protein
MTTAPAPFIRPLRLAELLDQAIGLYRRNFLKFIGIIAIPYIPLGILQGVATFLTASSTAESISDPNFNLSNPSYWLGVGGSLVILILQFILVQGIATAALTGAIADNYMGQPVDILGAYRKLGGSWARLLGVLLLVVLIWIAMFVWTIIPCVGWLTGPGMLFFLGAMVVPLIAPVVVLEKQGGFRALRRAWDLARSRFWWLLGYALVMMMFSWLVISGPVYLLTFGLDFLLRDTIDIQQQLILNNVTSTLTAMAASLLYLPLSLTIITVVYFDLRVSSEGLDLALQAAESNPQVNIVSLAETSPEPQGSFVTGREVGYFVLLTLVGAALYFLLITLGMGIAMLVTSSL